MPSNKGGGKGGGKGGYLFQRAKKNDKVFNMHESNQTILYEPNSKGKVGGFLVTVKFLVTEFLPASGRCLSAKVI